MRPLRNKLSNDYEFTNNGYKLIEKEGCEGIKCMDCKMISYSKQDILNKYCGCCHKYHENKGLVIDIEINDNIFYLLDNDNT